MKALSIKQPWAHLIIHHGKDIENRKWATAVRGTVLIHASKKVDKIAMARFKHIIGDTELQTGGIVGSVNIVDVVTDSSSLWFQGPKGFVLRDPTPLPFLRCKGQLGFFNVNYDKLVKEQR